MNRRETVLALLFLSGLARTLPLVAQERTEGHPFRIGFAVNLTPAGREATQELMGEFGWKYGRDYTFIESGVPYGPAIEEAARRIVAEKPDLIFVATTAFAVAVQRLTSTIPIVMYTSGYPVAAGVALSLARPGKNVTGSTVYAGTGIWGKLLQLLSEVKPGVKRIGLLWDYLPPAFPREEIDFGLGELRDNVRSLGLATHIAEVTRPEQVTAALAALDSWRAEALLVTSGPVMFPEMSRIMKFAIGKRLPTITDSNWQYPVEPRPLLAYGPPISVLRRQAVGYIDKILRGAKPSELPIQQPAKFELVVNMKTAKALGLTIPQSILLRADQVIE